MRKPFDTPVWIMGSGVVSCVGIGREALWQNTVKGQSGIKDGIGRVNDLNATPDTRAVTYAVEAIQQALAYAGWTELRPTDAFILATTTGQILLWDNALADYLSGASALKEFQHAFAHQPLGRLLDEIAAALNFQGSRLLVTSACNASTQALALASMWIQSGQAKRCLVGGVEVLCQLTLQGFKCLQLLSTETARPFDLHRKGINLSEGAAFFCVEKDYDSRTPMARLTGYGLSTDSFHMTSPEPHGRGSFQAMSAALSMSGLSPSDISWIHAHGTGSQLNDTAEASAISSLFESHRADHRPPVSSTKGIHGHALGASGALEVALCLEALRNQYVPATLGLNTADPELSLHLPELGQSQRVRHILKNTLGFGGNNGCLILSHPDEVTHRAI